MTDISYCFVFTVTLFFSILAAAELTHNPYSTSATTLFNRSVSSIVSLNMVNNKVLR